MSRPADYADAYQFMWRVAAQEDGVEPPGPDALALVETAADQGLDVNGILMWLRAEMRARLEGLEVNGNKLTARQIETLADLMLSDGTASEYGGGWHLGSLKALARLGLVNVREYTTDRKWKDDWHPRWEAQLTEFGRTLYL